MLPTFYVLNDRTHATKVWSDIDFMRDTKQKVGFEETESDIFATIETDKSPPGYLQLREFGTGELRYYIPETKHFESPGPSDYALFLQHGPALKCMFPSASCM